MRIVHFPLSIQYALKGLLFLAHRPQGETFKVGEIAESESLPAHFLGKIFQRLTQANILRSKRGPGGGFFLLRPAEKIRLCEVMETLSEVEFQDRPCLLGLGPCGTVQNCPVHDIVKQAEDEIHTLTRKTTLRDLKKRKEIFK